MAILGAIFDCDGTLVDSMSMWNKANEWPFEKCGVPVPEGFYQRVEPLTVREMSRIVHEEYGLFKSADDVYEQVLAHVRDCYRNDIKPFDGVFEFLDSLRAAGIPMVCASSTPVREVRCALEAQGLDTYFKDVVSTEECGRDKEFPDVYLEACRRLGHDPNDATIRDQIWVFEDAPFGVQTSRKAGFKVVGLMNDHDGRREEDVRPWADLYVHGYAELSLPLMLDYERPAAVDPAAAPLRALIVDGSPEPSSPELVAALAARADYVIAADKGAETLVDAGAAPQVFVGDSDSVSPVAGAWASHLAQTDIAFPSEKYATDLSAAIACAEHEASRAHAPLDLTVTCAAGGRIDHLLAVVGLLAQAPAVACRMVEDSFELRILSEKGQRSWNLGAEGDATILGATFSVIALAPDTRADIEGARWNLTDRPMELLGDLGISNVVESKGATVTCRCGCLAVVLVKECKKGVIAP